MPAGELLVHERDVRRRLVHEAPAGLVDDEGAGNRALGDQHAHHAVWPLERRHPPGVVHQIDCATDDLGRSDPVAGVVGRARAVVVFAAVPKEMFSHLTVVLETPGSQQDPLARPDADHGAGTLGSYADNSTGLVGDQRLQRRIEPQRNARLLGGEPEAPDQSPTQGVHMSPQHNAFYGSADGVQCRAAARPGAHHHVQPGEFF